MMFDTNTQHLEAKHSHCSDLDSALAFHDHVDGSCEQVDESITIGRRLEESIELEFHNLAHDLHCLLYLTCRVPTPIFSCTLRLGAFCTLARRCCARFL